MVVRKQVQIEAMLKECEIQLRTKSIPTTRKANDKARIIRETLRWVLKKRSKLDEGSSISKS